MSAGAFDRRAVWSPARPPRVGGSPERGRQDPRHPATSSRSTGRGLLCRRSRQHRPRRLRRRRLDRPLPRAREGDRRGGPAQLSSVGSLARSDLLHALRLRLEITDWYKKHPEIENEEIEEPVWIIGMGRCGTTIFHEVLSQDPQFRSPKHWESAVPVPAADFGDPTDPRIERADPIVTLPDRDHTRVPGDARVQRGSALRRLRVLLPRPSARRSATSCSRSPSYAEYFARQDLSYMFAWHKRFLKLLQSGYRRPHWLLKNPTHMDKDSAGCSRPIPTGRSSSCTATRSSVPTRSPASWERSIGGTRTIPGASNARGQRHGRGPCSNVGQHHRLDRGRHDPKGSHTHLQFKDLCERPLEATEKCYRELGLTPSEGALDKMQEYLDKKPKGVYGTHKYKIGGGRQDVIDAERKMYARYQEYFGVPSEA